MGRISLMNEVVKLQIKLNYKIVPNWLTANLDWQSAILAEAGELIESSGYKWWKATEPDSENIKVEAVDLAHFLISQALCLLVLKGVEAEPLKHATHEVVEILDRSFDKVSVCDPEDLLDTHRIKHKVRDLIDASFDLDVEAGFSSLVEILALVGVDKEEFYNIYVSKNLLNEYRSSRGYKANASYVKYVDGIEDNVAFLDLVKTIPPSQKDLLFESMDSLGYGLQN